MRFAIPLALAAGASIASLMLRLGVRDVTMCDIDGTVWAGRPGNSPALEELAQRTNPRGLKGTLAETMVGTDVFVGVLAPGIASREMVASMAERPIVFSMANPVPEIMSDAFDNRVVPAVAKAVADEARRAGLARA